jgi:hypothetical protein
MRPLTAHLAKLAVLATCAACYNVDKQDVVTKCVVRATIPNWATAGVDVDVSSPDRCPFQIASGSFQDQTFEGIVTGDPLYIQSNGYGLFDNNTVIHVRVFNRRDPPDLVNKLTSLAAARPVRRSEWHTRPGLRGMPISLIPGGTTGGIWI